MPRNSRDTCACQPSYLYVDSRIRCAVVISLDGRVLKGYGHDLDEPTTTTRRRVTERRTVNMVNRQPSLKVVTEGLSDDNATTYRFLRFYHMGRDAMQRASEDVPKTMPKWDQLKVGTR